ncbi:MAG: hypothetical protein PVH19_01895 [Planctomycetia bacterium]|jgi:hypothetical protein
MLDATFRKLFWKEFRMLWPLWIAVVILGTLIDLGIFLLFEGTPERMHSVLFVCAGLMPILYATGSAGTQFAWELERGTFQRLQMLPVTARKVIWSKLAWTLASTVLLFAAMWGISFLFSGCDMNAAKLNGSFFKIYPLGVLEFIAWGMFFSMRSRSPLLATIQAGFIASLIFGVLTTTYGLTFDKKMYGEVLFGVYQDVWPYRLGILLLLSAILFRMASNWFDHWRRVESREREELRLFATTACRKNYLHGDHGFLALCQQNWRQNRSLYLPFSISLLLLIIFCVLWLTTPLHNMIIGEVLASLWGLYGFLAITLIPSSIFGADQAHHGFRFFAHHGISPKKVWFSRLLAPSFLFFVLCGSLGSMLLFQVKGIELRENLIMLKAAPLIILCCLMSGAFFSILCKSRVLAWLWTFIGVYGFIIIASLLLEQYPVGNAWALLLPLAAFTVAGYWGVADHIHNRSRQRVWIKRIVLFSGCLIAFVATTIYQRATLFPDVELPKSQVAYYEQTWKSPESEQLLEELTSLCHRSVTTVKTERPLDWLKANGQLYPPSTSDDFNGQASILDSGTLTKVFRIAHSEHSVDWLKLHYIMGESDPKLEKTRTALIHLINELIYTANYYSQAGKPKKSLDCLLAAIRLSPPWERAHTSTVVFDLLPRWSIGPGITPELLQKAIQRIAKLPPPANDIQCLILAECYYYQKMLDDPKQIERRADPTHNTIFAWMPWERARIKRLVKNSTQSEIDYIAHWKSYLQSKDPDYRQNPMGWYLDSPYYNKWIEHWGGIFYSVDLHYRNAMVDLHRTVSKLWEAELFQRLALTSLAIRAYQLEHDGQLPKTLDELPSIPRPYSMEISGPQAANDAPLRARSLEIIIQDFHYRFMPAGPAFGFRAEGFHETTCFRPGVVHRNTGPFYSQSFLTSDLAGTPCLILDQGTFFRVYGSFGDHLRSNRSRDEISPFDKQPFPPPTLYPLPFTGQSEKQNAEQAPPPQRVEK